MQDFHVGGLGGNREQTGCQHGRAQTFQFHNSLLLCCDLRTDFFVMRITVSRQQGAHTGAAAQDCLHYSGQA
ncbi:hypothetical protein D3C78_1410940 [compost metagenome]